jgi:hypothetical protein
MKQLIKEVNTKYYEEIDSDGKRTIRIESVKTNHFSKNNETKNNPTTSIIVEYL